jgi:hypothetical protein
MKRIRFSTLFHIFVFPWLVIAGGIILAWLLAGCATVYEIERCHADVCMSVKIKSRREFSDGLSMRYDRDSGNFEFTANQVSTHVSPLEQAAADIIRVLPQLATPQVPE